jgi:hypothetical protein
MEGMFEEVYTSKHGKVKIFKVVGVDQRSKSFAADPSNRLCDAEGSWYCPGQYPPGLLALFDTETKEINPEAQKRVFKEPSFSHSFLLQFVLCICSSVYTLQFSSFNFRFSGFRFVSEIF